VGERGSLPEESWDIPAWGGDPRLVPRQLPQGCAYRANVRWNDWTRRRAPAEASGIRLEDRSSKEKQRSHRP
jgi:hypothetical protein